MLLRSTALLALLLLVGCQWEGRPDGTSRSSGDGSYEASGTTMGPLGDDAEIVDPLGDPIVAPSPSTQPPPADGTTDVVE